MHIILALHIATVQKSEIILIKKKMGYRMIKQQVTICILSSNRRYFGNWDLLFYHSTADKPAFLII